MACPGGCVGGGGQSLPTTKKIIEIRSKSLYAIDDAKTVKCAHENLAIKTIYDQFFTDQTIRHKILHTFFSARTKAPITKLQNSKETL
jgi:iron only hydrogenase large subunit-like protein